MLRYKLDTAKPIMEMMRRRVRPGACRHGTRAQVGRMARRSDFARSTWRQSAKRTGTMISRDAAGGDCKRPIEAAQTGLRSSNNSFS
jgi:hypothetical protein